MQAQNEQKRSEREAEAKTAETTETGVGEGAAATDAKKRKRKRNTSTEELEIDVNLPPPASKKEARKAKKVKFGEETATTGTHTAHSSKEESGKHSEYAVWIGNIPYSVTKDALRQFLVDNALGLKSEHITRINLPAPTKPVPADWKNKPLNQGFAYVDFSTSDAMVSARALSETKMHGRALLIKFAKNFEGRPEKPKTEEDSGGKGATDSSNPPNKRVFVGNLSFDTTEKDLEDHFSSCGAVKLVHMATFQDSGTCKGYAWVTFGDLDAAWSAVRGFIWKNEADLKKNKKKKTVEADDNADESTTTDQTKKRKWFLNKLGGRDLHCEFAEDKTTRYNKRHGKDTKSAHTHHQYHEAVDGVNPARSKNFTKDSKHKKKLDPRSVKPGAAHANAQRASAAIVPGKGKKTVLG